VPKKYLFPQFRGDRIIIYKVTPVVDRVPKSTCNIFFSAVNLAENRVRTEGRAMIFFLSCSTPPAIPIIAKGVGLEFVSPFAPPLARPPIPKVMSGHYPSRLSRGARYL